MEQLDLPPDNGGRRALTPVEIEEMENNRRTCWVCFACDEDDPSALWIQPCKCKGTTKWVHNHCLQLWIDEKQGNNPTVAVRCSQCNAPYIIQYPPLGLFLVVVDYGDQVIDKVSPLLCGTAVIGSVYWSAVSYGALTVMQVFGQQDGYEMMERADPFFLLVALPTIPLGLLLAKMLRWEDYVLQLWRKHAKTIRRLKSFFGIEEKELPKREPAASSNALDFVSTTRLVCGAFLLPTFATIVGKYVFRNVNDSLRRTLLGGGLFTILKGALKIYYRQQQYVRLAQRTIAPFCKEASTSI